jgi:hypothetical protein
VCGRAAAEDVNALLNGGAVEPGVPLAQAVDVAGAVLGAQHRCNIQHEKRYKDFGLSAVQLASRGSNMFASMLLGFFWLVLAVILWAPQQ